MRLTISVAPVSSAPVEPAETTASPFPSRRRFSATVMEESFLRRVAVLGSSSMVTISRASTISNWQISSGFRQRSISSFRPTSTTSTPSSFRARSAPFTISPGALSPPMASTMILNAENLLLFQVLYDLKRTLRNLGVLVSLSFYTVIERRDDAEVYIHGLEIAHAAAGDV